MRSIPAWLYRKAGEDITVEPYLGAGPFGDAYGPPVTVRAIVDAKRRLVRSATGEQVVSETTAHCPLSVDVPTDSRVTIRGQVTTVIGAHRRDGGRLRVPSHLEVVLA